MAKRTILDEVAIVMLSDDDLFSHKSFYDYQVLPRRGEVIKDYLGMEGYYRIFFIIHLGNIPYLLAEPLDI
jgi:hypothetical protein